MADSSDSDSEGETVRHCRSSTRLKHLSDSDDVAMDESEEGRNADEDSKGDEDEAEDSHAGGDIMPISAELLAEGMGLLGVNDPEKDLRYWKSAAALGREEPYRFYGPQIGQRTRNIVPHEGTVFGVILAMMPGRSRSSDGTPRPEDCLYLNMLLGLPDDNGKYAGHDEIRGVANEIDYAQLCKATASFLHPAEENEYVKRL